MRSQPRFTGAITRRDVDDLYKSMRDARDYIASRDESSKKSGVGARLLGAGEVAAGAAAMGLLYGRTTHWNIPGTPLPIGLAVGAAGHLLDFFGVLGPYGKHVTNFSNGALASWATMMGAGYGAQWRASSGAPAAPLTGGCMPSLAGCSSAAAPPAQLSPPSPVAYGPRPSALTEAELAAMSRAYR